MRSFSSALAFAFSLIFSWPAAADDITSLMKLFPALADFQPEALRIVDGQFGLSRFGPEEAVYVLKIERGQFRGSASYSIGSARSSGAAALQQDAVVGFLRTALQVPIEEKPYRPKIVHTDDYPSHEIELQSGGQLLRIWTRSQGWSPWGLDFAGRSFVADTNELTNAFIPIQKQLDWSQTKMRPKEELDRRE